MSTNPTIISRKSKAQVINNRQFFTELIAQLSEGRRVKIRAKGWSMLPLLWDDRDTLTLAPIAPDDIKVGKIVFAQMGTGRYVVHRIVARKNDRLTLRGDGNPYQEEYVHVDKVLGELVAITRGGKELDKDTLFWKLITHLWPRNGFLRRVLLFSYRRLVIRQSPKNLRRDPRMDVSAV